MEDSSNATEATPFKAYTGYPSFIKSFVYPEENAENVYIEMAEYPKELRWGIQNILPLNFADEAWRLNLTQPMIGADGEEMPSFLDQMPLHFKQFFMSPHIIYPGAFFMLLNTKVVSRDAPLEDWKKKAESSLYNTTTVYQVYKFYRSVLHFFEGHFMMKMSEPWKNRTMSVIDRFHKRLFLVLQSYQKHIDGIKSVNAIRKLITSNAVPNPMQVYSPVTADDFAMVSFRFNVSILRMMELALIELLQIDPDLAFKHNMLTPTVVPPVEVIPKPVRTMAIEENVGIITLCNQHHEEDKYDTDHIEKHQFSEKFLLSPSYFFQTFLHASHIRPPPKTKTTKS